MSLHSPAISRVTGLEISQSLGVTLESVEEPIQDDFAKSSTIFVVECTAMADGDIALPGRCATGQSLEVTLSL